jgi:hypothetical protein
MTSRERLRKALHHEPTDRPPIDLGATPVTGIAASTLHRLRHALGLAPTPVKVHEPLQLLGQVEDDVRQKLGIDTVGLWSPMTKFGYRNDGWKPWKLQDGTDVLISQHFTCTTDENGDVLAYPQGDLTAPPSARLPKGGYYFDAIVRQEPLDEDHLDPQDWAEQFTPIADQDLDYFQKESERLYRDTDYAIVGVFGQAGLGDVGQVPGVGIKAPKGIRDPQLWYEALLTHPEYIRGIFEMQTEMALKNLELYRQAVGDRIDVIYMSGTDFGTQRGLFVSIETFRTLWKPFYRRLNDWVHQHTPWKTLYHSCGSIAALLDDFIQMGVDIINPVQCSAVGMDPQMLKKKYGPKLVFWGGGVDTQKVLPFGTPTQVRQQVAERLTILSQAGGYVFTPIHNIQHATPIENLLAMFDVLHQ